MNRCGAGPVAGGERVQSFSELAATIGGARARCGRVRLVAVDGPGGAGKSVFAERLSRALGGVPIVHTDDFASWDNPHDWWDRLETDVLEPLARGETARFRTYDWSKRRLGGWRAVPPDDVILLEGVSSARSAVSARLSLAVWVETSPAERLARGLARDGEQMRPAWERWMAAEDRHFALDGTTGRADLVVDGASQIPYDRESEFVRLR